MNTDLLIVVILCSILAFFLILCLICLCIYKCEKTHDYKAVPNN